MVNGSTARAALSWRRSYPVRGRTMQVSMAVTPALRTEGRRHRVTQGVNSGFYLSCPKVAPQSWFPFAPVPNRLPTWNEKPVRFRTVSCGRGVSVGKPLAG